MTEERTVRVNLNISVDLRNQFKSATAARGENMTDVILRCIEEYIAKYTAGTAKSTKKGRRP